MLSKANIKILLIVFVALLVAVILIKRQSKKQYSTFKSDLVELDTSKVTSIEYGVKGGELTNKISREKGIWKVYTGDYSGKADTTAIVKTLQQLMNLKSKRVAARGEDAWGDYQLHDTAATKVVIKQKGEDPIKLYIGRFSYQQPQNPYQRRGTMTTFVRMGDDDKVHAVDGFLSMTFQEGASNFRNKMLAQMNKSDIFEIQFNYPSDSSFILAKKEGRWFVNDTKADSASVVRYLGKISSLNSPSFINDFEAGNRQPQFTMQISGKNFNPIEIKAYPTGDSLDNLAVISSYNPGAVFSGTKSGLFKKAFVAKDEFIE